MDARLQVKIQCGIEIRVLIDAEDGFDGVAVVVRAVDRDGRKSHEKAAVRHNGQLSVTQDTRKKRYVTVVVEPHHLYTLFKMLEKGREA